MFWRELPALSGEVMAGFQDDFERGSGFYESVVRTGTFGARRLWLLRDMFGTIETNGVYE